MNNSRSIEDMDRSGGSAAKYGSDGLRLELWRLQPRAPAAPQPLRWIGGGGDAPEVMCEATFSQSDINGSDTVPFAHGPTRS